MYSSNTIRRYILFQIPELALTISVLYIIKYFYDYPAWIIWLVVFLSIAKDLLMFKFTWRSYIVHKKEDYAGVIGKKGIAKEDFAKTGLVMINGELWKTAVNAPVKKGDLLVITEAKGLLLVAEKVH